MRTILGGRAPRSLAFIVMGVAAFMAAAPAEARITKLELESPVSAFGATAFGSVGPYEILRGKAYGELSPTDPKNAVIVDLHLAPTNGQGKVEYEMDVFILKPVSLFNGNRRLFMDVNNRGAMRLGTLNDAANTNNPTLAAHAGTGFIMRQGYVVASNGWDFGADGAGLLGITVPPAGNPGEITGPSYEYINFDNSTTMMYALSYPAATLDKSQATLTVRQRLDDIAEIIPDDGWEYTSAAGTAIRLLPGGTPFLQSHVYEFTYTARDPVVAGVGFAATRDFVSFLRHAYEDDFGNPNPLAGFVDHTYTYSISQPSRYLNDFQTLGFNEDESGRQVLDGILSWTGGGSGIFMNYRFAQTGRTERNRQNHLYPEGLFPFAHQVLTDHLSGRTGGRSERCMATDTCPKRFEGNTANEYWVKAGSLLHTDTRGRDLKDPDHVRFYLMSGLSHGVGNVNSMGVCQQFLNPTSPYPALRALLVALDQWVSQGIAPPKSEVPRHANHTAFAFTVPGSQTGVVPQKDLRWPDIPGVTYNGLITTRNLLDFGPMFDQGIVSNFPPSVADRPSYPIFVSKVDKDGNELAGIRLPPVEAPIATTTGWALRRAGFSENEGCEGAGQHIRFKTTKAERQASGDPRPSLEERYKNHEGYVKAVRKAAEKLEKDRFLLLEDVERYIADAMASNVLK
jgi:hypothetical protein